MSLDYLSSLSYSQKKRLTKINIEKFYLIDKKTQNNSLIWIVTGSTFNVYNVTLNLQNNSLKCNCQDFTTWAKKAECLCKHCCFVLVKILKNDIDLNQSTIFQSQIFSQFEKLNIINNFKSEIQHNNDHEYKLVLNQYDKMLRQQLNPSCFESVSKTDHNCPICYEDIEHNIKHLECPDCKKSFHKNCIEMWLMNGTNNSCPYCRSDKWKQYLTQNTGYKNIFII